MSIHRNVAQRLAELHEEPFGGKDRSRYRISMKFLKQLAGRRRLYEDDISLIGRELAELGLILINMETFFAVLSTRTMSSYRRVGPEQIASHSFIEGSNDDIEVDDINSEY